MAKKHQILLSVTEEQEHAIMELFGEKRWKYANLCKYFSYIENVMKIERIRAFDVSTAGKVEITFSLPYLE